MKRDVIRNMLIFSLPVEKIWPDGKPLQADIDKLFLRRPEPFSEFQINEDWRSGEGLDNVWQNVTI